MQTKQLAQLEDSETGIGVEWLIEKREREIGRTIREDIPMISRDPFGGSHSILIFVAMAS